ncbi:MAG: hypothetical protein KKE02_24100 [Alphaproteobacteria bacterium]|nr:hypothetical protein [Alphaproteobacteria bacterium]MBU1516545.1 hypothetical protein [Alphaproteobacteria bacterium]MBU2094302.1 hypothetical protein [Alphaproteobacteria bacterium]MBU2154121.1 hypothetical protein [Alphaproteobacteria bacterium]MBU2307472.1 hypothetical protein [Alphaproteobacteria bacterium]
MASATAHFEPVLSPPAPVDAVGSTPDPVLAAHSRTIVRWMARHLLRSFEVAREMHGGDVMQTIVFTTIWSLNVGHLGRNAGYAAIGDVPPDTMRRPLSVHRLARRLHLPEETVRRYVGKLIDAGLCERVGRQGVIVPRTVFERPDVMQLAMRQVEGAVAYCRAVSDLVGAPTRPAADEAFI